MKNLFLVFSTIFVINAFANEKSECKNRGDLDILYCDENKDLVADPPKDSKKLKEPKNLVLALAPGEDPALLENVFQPFISHLSKCINKKVVFFQVQSNPAEIEAMRSGRLHVGGFSAGSAPFAVNIAGVVPFATEGFTDGSPRIDDLIVVVKNNSSFQKLADLKGRKVAHSSPSSNIGHMAPIALFPEQGLVPEKDYKIIFSGKYDQSVMGVFSGDYDAGIVGSQTFDRIIKLGQIKKEDFRIIYRSLQKFPTTAYSHAHDLEPKFLAKLKQCFFDFRFPKEMSENLSDTDRFVPVTYQETWASLRDVAEKNGVFFTKSAFEKSNTKK